MDQKQLQVELMKELGLDNLPQEKQEQLLVKMTEVLLKRIFVETMKKLDDQDKGKYQKLTEGKEATPAQLEEFLRSKISNYDELLQKVISEFKEEIKKEFKS